MKIYMYVTDDEFELPIAVADTAEELAAALHTTKNTVLSSISKHRKRYIKLDIEEGEDD